MAARRLIIVMLILLGVSTGLAIVTPDPRDRDSTEEATGPTGSTGATGATGPTGGEDEGEEGPEPALVEATVVADEGLRTVTARPGDRVVLTVQPATPADVEIKDLGLTATAGAGAPAVFDFIMPSEPASLHVTQFGNDRPMATVSSEKRDPKRADREGKARDDKAEGEANDAKDPDGEPETETVT